MYSGATAYVLQWYLTLITVCVLQWYIEICVLGWYLTDIDKLHTEMVSNNLYAEMVFNMTICMVTWCLIV